jgi:hypothetical protein
MSGSGSANDDEDESEPKEFITITGHQVVKGPRPFSDRSDKSNDRDDE